MVFGIFGENCVGKSTLAEALRARLGGRIYTGKDYLRLAKNEAEARSRFLELLEQATESDPVFYVISEQAQMGLLPERAVRVLVTAPLEDIKARFARRTCGELPPPVAAMLERNHGAFDGELHDFHLASGEMELDGFVDSILEQK